MSEASELYYLASPYTDPDEEVMEKRYLAALDTTARLTKKGLLVFSPIVHFHEAAKAHDLPRAVGFWRNHNRQMLLRCTDLIVLNIAGHHASTGVQWELGFAEGRRLRIWRIEPFADILARYS